MFQFLASLFGRPTATARPTLNVRLTLDGMEDRSTPSAAGTSLAVAVPAATTHEPLLVSHPTPLQIHEFNPQPDPPVVVAVAANTWAG
jgi:hypothetical protein